MARKSSPWAQRPHEVLSLNWSTFAPIDLGVRLRGVRGERALDQYLARSGWALRDNARDEMSILGVDTVIFEYGDDEESATLYVPTSGFAVLRLDGTPITFAAADAFSAPTHLRNRRSRHRDLIACRHHSLPTSDFEAFVLEMRRAASSGTPRHLRRLDDPRVLHYVMSVYYLHGCDACVEALPPHMIRQLKACLDPGIANLDDTPFLAEGHDGSFEAACLLVDQIDGAPVGLARTELAEDVTMVASWSSVFVIGRPSADDYRLMGALQARVQSAWLAAWSVGDLSRRLVADVEDREISTRRVEAIAFELGYLENEVAARLDASLSTRLDRVWKMLVETSSLEAEWHRAGVALAHARGYADFVNREANHRFQVAFEALLLLFALSQLAPILLKLPITNWHAVESQWHAMVALLGFLAVGFLLVAKRRR